MKSYLEIPYNGRMLKVYSLLAFMHPNEEL